MSGGGQFLLLLVEFLYFGNADVFFMGVMGLDVTPVELSHGDILNKSFGFLNELHFFMILLCQCLFFLPDGRGHMIQSFFVIFNDLFLLPQVVLFYRGCLFHRLTIFDLLHQFIFIGSQFADFGLDLIDLGFRFVEF